MKLNSSYFDSESIEKIIQFWFWSSLFVGFGYYSFRFLYFNKTIEGKVFAIRPELQYHEKVPELDWFASFVDSSGNEISVTNVEMTSINVQTPPIKIGETRQFLIDENLKTFKYIETDKLSDKLLNNLSAIPFSIIVIASLVMMLFYSVKSLKYTIRSFVSEFEIPITLEQILNSSNLIVKVVLRTVLLAIWVVSWILIVHLILILPNLSSFIIGPLLSLFLIATASSFPYKLTTIDLVPSYQKVFQILQNLGFLVGATLIFKEEIKKFLKLNQYDTITNDLIDSLIHFFRFIFNF